MGNQPASYIDNCLKFDRILDADNEVYVGIGKVGLGMSSQAIRYGGFKNNYHRLNSFIEEENKLQYKFENNVSLTLEKMENNIFMNLIHNNKVITSKVLDPVITKNYKPIKFNDLSNELDKMEKLFTSK